MHKISHLVESHSTCLFEYLIGGQLLGVTANQSQLFSPCKVILLISFINSFLFFALPYPFKDTRRCKSNNTTKERNILWHSTTQNQWNENYVMGNSTFFFFLGPSTSFKYPYGGNLYTIFWIHAEVDKVADFRFLL